MHDEEGPRRLRQGADTPEPLLRALDALRKGVNDTARLERVGQKMEAVLNAPPTAAGLPTTAGAGLFGNKLSAVKLILGGLGLLAPLLFFQFMDDATVPPSTPAGSPQPSAAEQKSESAEADKTAVTAVPSAVEVSGAEADAQLPTPLAPRAAHAAAARTRKQREPSMRAERQAELTDQHEADHAIAKANTVAEATTSEAARPSAAEPSAAQATPATPATPKEKTQREAAAQPDAPPPVSEAGLLLKARQALKSDPALALRLATEHQSRFATGRLAPEREVLAIEALRHLGRKREADERLHKFEASYPGSIHLKRLHEAR